MTENPHDIQTHPDLAIGVDLGGTNIRLALYRGLQRARRASDPPPAPIASHRELVGDARDPEPIAARLAQLVDDLLGAAGAADRRVPIGIGIAAMLHGFDGVVANSPALGWRDVPFGDLVRARLTGHRPVSLYNDVNAITYGEHAFGAGRGIADVLAVFVGTGVGAGVVMGGRLIEGATNCAGEIGHVKYSYGDDSPACNCGMRGCVEAYIGGSYLQARIRRDLSSGIDSSAIRIAGGDPTRVHPGHLDVAAAEGDEYALAVYTEIAMPLAVALGNAISLLNPARLILGGGVLARTPILRDHVITMLELVTSRALLDPLSIATTALGDDAGILGSALLASERDAGQSCDQ